MLAALLAIVFLGLRPALPGPAAAQAPARPGHVAHIPLLLAPGTPATMPTAHYEALTVFSAPADRPAAEHPDLNLALRGYSPTGAAAALVDISGPADPLAPRLTGLLEPGGTPPIAAVYRVNEWDWPRNSLGPAIAYPEVTLAGLAARPGQTVALPSSGYDIGNGYQALVLYAAPGRLTLKYTREDNVVHGYTLHLEGLAVHPDLLALYRACDAAGRSALPALRGGQPLGVAAGYEVGVAVRDAGSFMDPRSRKDWW